MNIEKLLENVSQDSTIEIIDLSEMEKYIQDNKNNSNSISILKITVKGIYESKINELLPNMRIKHCFATDEERRKIVMIVDDTKENIKKLRKQVDSMLIKYVG